MERKISIDDLYQLRCIVIRENSDNFEARDYNGKKYFIAKNEATKSYKVGTDSTFYATKQEEGLFLKKTVLYPLTSKEYEEIVTKQSMRKMVVGSFA